MWEWAPSAAKIKWQILHPELNNNKDKNTEKNSLLMDT